MESVYLAARYSSKELIRTYALQLRSLRIDVTSSWLDEPHDPLVQLSEVSPEQKAKYAIQNVRDIQTADGLILFTQTGLARPGHNTEFGIGLGLGKVLIIVGPEEDIFHWVPWVLHYSTWRECLMMLQGIAATAEVLP